MRGLEGFLRFSSVGGVSYYRWGVGHGAPLQVWEGKRMRDSKTILRHFGFEGVLPGAYGIEEHPVAGGGVLESISPIDGEPLGTVSVASADDYERIVRESVETFQRWREVPAPRRGELVRQVGLALRDEQDALGALVTLEMGKIFSEGRGEVQEAIDIADFAVGLSRQLYGLSMHSERPHHRMFEQWHPLGPIGVISAFNFPVAVWAWNAMVAAVCGDTIIWKPSEITPLTSIATTRICRSVAAEFGFPGLFSLIIDNNAGLGKRLAADPKIPLISATGSCAMGRAVGEAVARRLGRALLELGGNNAVIVMDDADLELAARAILFGAVGTAGQRCTSTRRVLVHRSVRKKLVERLLQLYVQVRIGDPLEEKTLMGPLVHEAAVRQYKFVVTEIGRLGGEILCGGKVLEDAKSPYYVEPTLALVKSNFPLLAEETFAPIAYIVEVDSLDEALRVHNAVPQGLSSAIFSTSIRNSEKFLSASGSDCGIANVNIGTSGAEIGGAFGGEKDTGGGRESGSDAWKIYMRRQTNTINYSLDLPLAQGVQFNVE